MIDSKIYAYVLAIAIVLLSCKESAVKMKPRTQPQLTNEEMQRLVLLDTNYTYPVAIAKETALKVATQMKDGQNRVISNEVTVPSLYSITGKTNITTDFSISKPKIPSLYVINFKDSKGFVVVSADK